MFGLILRRILCILLDDLVKYKDHELAQGGGGCIIYNDDFRILEAEANQESLEIGSTVRICRA